MGYKMTELTPHVRAGRRSDGALDLEVWQTPHGWEPRVEAIDDEPENIFIPEDAVGALFEYLR